MEAAIHKPTFRESSGRANEVNYWVFDYDSAKEREVRERIEYMKKKNAKGTDGFELVVFDLYDMIMDYLEEKDFVKSYERYETRRGFDYIVRAVSTSMKMNEDDSILIKKIVEQTPENAIVFLSLQGVCCNRIAKTLEDEEIPTPRAFLMDKYGKYVANERVKHPCAWAKVTVANILKNPVYLGHTVAQRYTTRSFKDKRIMEKPEEQWIIVENTHEAIIDQATFETVQQRVTVKQPCTWENNNNIFRGLVYCGECGGRMVFSAREGRKSLGSFCCNTHRRYRGKECSTHYITLEQLQELMLEDIRRHACLAAKDKEKYIDYLISLYQKKMDEGAFVKQKELDAVSNRLKELDQIIKRLYEDSALGRISFERYTEMSKGYIDEQKQLKSDLAVLEEALYGKKQMLSSMRQFADLVERYTDIRDVSSELLHTLIDRIVVHEKEMEGDEIIMRVDVYLPVHRICWRQNRRRHEGSSDPAPEMGEKE